MHTISVHASQRPQSKAEFVIRARDLLIYSIKKSKGLEKSLTFFGKQSLYETAQKIREDVVRGNSIYPTCREDVLARHEHFRDARAGLYHLIHLIGVMEEVSSKLTHKSACYWASLCYQEISLVTAVMKSDSKRFKNI